MYQWKLKSRKFYMYIFYFLFEVCACNTFVLLKRFGARTDYNSRTGYKQFRLQLSKELIGQYNERKSYTLPSLMIPVRKRSTPAHFPTKGKKARCHYCYNSLNIRHESSIRCTRCDVSLCIEPRQQNSQSCFELYHTN